MSDPNTNPPNTQSARLARAEAIFFEIAGLSPADRAPLIDKLCAGDDALRKEVLDLVAAAGNLGSFLEQPALGREFDQLNRDAKREAPDALLNSTLGHYRIDRKLDSGGMGTVYLAQRADGQFDQAVAIKVVKRGLDTDEVLRRFAEERQTLAALNHPNIARLLDAGTTPDGRPYIVMEFVDGLPIDEYCDKLRLSVRDRLKLFQGVCDAVHAAHQALVIHRDLKPGNILVTSAGVPKLLDFGIAKLLAPGTRSRVTSETERRLTPEYASPEQVQGETITTSSDVYSLGIILYELVTGVRPYYFGFKTTDEIRRVILGSSPSAPSAAVTIKATRIATGSSKSLSDAGAQTSATSAHTDSPAPVDHPRTRRVSSTRLRSLLRGDIDNIVLMALRKEPARRYTSAQALSADIERYLKGLPVSARRDTWGYRSRKFVRRHWLATAASIAFVTLLGAGLAIRTHQKNIIERQRDELVATNAALDQTRTFLVEILSGAQITGAGPSATLAQTLTEAADRLTASPPADAQTLAATQQAIGSAMASLGMLDRARPLLDASRSFFSKLDTLAPARIDSDFEQANLLFHESKPEQAEALVRDLLARDAQLPGSPSARTADLLNTLGACQRVQGKPADALATQREALAIRERTQGADSLAASESRNNIASALLSAGDNAGAVEEFRRTLAIREKLLRADHPLIIATRYNLALATLRTSDAKGAIALLEGVTKAWPQSFGPDHPGQSAALTALGQARRTLGQHEVAIATFERALAWQKAHNASAAALAATSANIGLTHAAAGDCARAIAMLEPIIDTLIAGKYKSLSIASLNELAKCYDQLNRADDAKHARDRAAALEAAK